MEIIVYVLKYGFVTALSVEALVIGWALFKLATEKARSAPQPATAGSDAPREGE